MSKRTCWACDSVISDSDETCQSCGMPLTEEKGGDIDDLLDSMTSPAKVEDFDMPKLPDDMDPQDLPDETSEDIDFLDSVIESSDSVTSEVKEEPTISDLSEDSVEDMPAMDDLIPDMPDFDELEHADIEDEVIEEEKGIIEFASISVIQRLRYFLPQWIYWGIVFTLIPYAALDIINPDFNPQTMQYGFDYTYRPLYILFGWIAFLVMGFHLSYKFRKDGFIPRFKHLLWYLLGLFVELSLIAFILLLLFNPGFLSNGYDPRNHYISVFPAFILTNFSILFFSLGFVSVYLGYTILWEVIYSFTPMKKVQELGNDVFFSSSYK